jgi:UDP-N-acetylglucosamine 2-epimerase (non-hydrolysing)
MRPRNVWIIFGTRPELIKLAPVIRRMKESAVLRPVSCSTGQHREMLRQVSDIFGVVADVDLDLMKPNQDLTDLTAGVMVSLRDAFLREKPDLIVVQGDTTTAFAASLAAFYLRIPVAHVEAGLRSYSLESPFPEEANRRFVSLMARYHFAPTPAAVSQLLSEGVPAGSVHLTGNTVVDAIGMVQERLQDELLTNKTKFNSGVESGVSGSLGQSEVMGTKDISGQMKEVELTEISGMSGVTELSGIVGMSEASETLGMDSGRFRVSSREFILITLHRREKFGRELELVFETIRSLADEYPHLDFVYPVHLNPKVKGPAQQLLGDVPNIRIIPPQDYLAFGWLMQHCRFIMSDSGGVQEEAWSFRKPVLVLRDVTERMEAVHAGYAFLVSSDPEAIRRRFREVDARLGDGHDYFTMPNPFGDGDAAGRIVRILEEVLG